MEIIRHADYATQAVLHLRELGIRSKFLPAVGWLLRLLSPRIGRYETLAFLVHQSMTVPAQMVERARRPISNTSDHAWHKEQVFQPNLLLADDNLIKSNQIWSNRLLQISNSARLQLG